MALATYSDLQGAIQNYLARTDLAAFVPDWITLFETAANRRLRVRQMDAQAILTPVGGWADLPPDYLAWKEVTFATGNIYPSLLYLTPSALNDHYPVPTIGIPQAFTIYGGQIGLAPFQDDLGIWLDYVQKIPPLANGVNWLFTEHPDLYLFGSLAQAQAFVMDKETWAQWKIQRDEIFDEIDKLSSKSRGVGPMRVLGPTP